MTFLALPFLIRGTKRLKRWSWPVTFVWNVSAAAASTSSILSALFVHLPLVRTITEQPGAGGWSSGEGEVRHTMH
jgi:hypothetical protein